VLAKAVRDVELAVERGRPRASTRSTFQAVALLVREERTRLQAQDVPEHRRNEQLKRLDGIATALARTAARDGTLLTLLTDDAQVLPDTKALLRELRVAGGVELPEEEAVADAAAVTGAAKVERQVVPRSVISRQLANPFLEPDFSAPPPPPRPRLLATWELLGPLLRAFERASGGAPSCMTAAAPSSLRRRRARAHAAPGAGGRRGCRRAPHVPARRRAGLGKTAQALLAAQAADAYPLLAVVPNVVKTNWAREAQLWTPERAVTVVHGDGRHVDAFSDIVVVNYEVLDRTSAGSAPSASAGWSSTRRTSSRTRPRSARSTCSSSPSGSGGARRGRCSWPSPAPRSSTTSTTSWPSGSSSAGSTTTSRRSS
jgi:hypothetical protein